MNLEVIKLSEKSQTEKDKLTDKENKLVVTSWKIEMGRGNIW